MAAKVAFSSSTMRTVFGKGEFVEIPRENACSFNTNFQEQYLNKKNKLW